MTKNRLRSYRRVWIRCWVEIIQATIGILTLGIIKPYWDFKIVLKEARNDQARRIRKEMKNG